MIIFFISKKNENGENPWESNNEFFFVKEFGEEEPKANDTEIKKTIYSKWEEADDKS